MCSLTPSLTEDHLMAVLAVPGGSAKSLGFYAQGLGTGDHYNDSLCKVWLQGQCILLLWFVCCVICVVCMCTQVSASIRTYVDPEEDGVSYFTVLQ